MGRKIINLVYVLIVLAVVGGVGWYVFGAMNPTENEINQQIKQPVTVIDKDILDSPTVKQDLPKMQKNGNVPITISPDELGRTNPFLPY